MWPACPAGVLTTVLVVLYLAVFERPGQTWTTARTLAAYILGVSVLILLNGVVAFLWRLQTCGRCHRCSAGAVDSEVQDMPCLLPAVGVTFKVQAEQYDEHLLKQIVYGNPVTTWKPVKSVATQQPVSKPAPELIRVTASAVMAQLCHTATHQAGDAVVALLPPGQQ